MNKKKTIICVTMFLLIVIWIVGIYKLSSMNANSSNGKSESIITIFIEDTLEITNKYGITDSHPDENKISKATNLLNKPFRKVMHASVYFILATLIILLINCLFKNKKIWLSLLITVILIIILASLDEYHQSFVFGRTSDIKDVLIDTIGGLAGALFYGTYFFVYTKGYKRGLNEMKVCYNIRGGKNEQKSK